MAQGELKGSIDEVPYSFSNFGTNEERLEVRLKSKLPIVEGDFYVFYCSTDQTSNQIRTLTELSRIAVSELSKKEKIIVQIVVKNSIDDFGYALMKLFEEHHANKLTRGMVEIEDIADKQYVYIKNQGLTYLTCSSDAWDFYRKVYEYFLKPKLK